MKPIIPLLSPDYFAEITRNINATEPGDRVALISMSFDPAAPGIPGLVDALQKAAQRNVDVLLIIDALSFMLRESDGLPTGPIFWHRPLVSTKTPHFRRKLDALHAIEEAGGRYSIINMPTTRIINPYAGRSHIKATIINNTVYAGGCNLSGHDSVDMMLHFDNASIADWVYDHLWAISQKGSTQEAFKGEDKLLAVDDVTDLFFDSGAPGQSLIYEQALRLIDEAKEHVFITCQYFPDAVTVGHLERAIRRGVNVELYYNAPSQQEKLPQIGHYLVLGMAKLTKPKMLFSHALPKDHMHLHLKLIATEQAAILGSHNYVNAGVQFGTAEIAVLRRDPSFSQELIQKVRPLL